jgi:hypothetical protein
MKVKQAIPGMKFGMLTIVSWSVEKRRWLCKCDCGGETFAAITDMKSGKHVRCHCGAFGEKPTRQLPDDMGAKNRLFKRYQSNAREKGYDFNLSFDEVLYLTKQPCKYCGIAPSTPLNGTSNRVYYYNGIDRVNNTLGYSISNCVTACYMCNTSKNNFDIVDWTKWIQRLYNHMNTSGMFND